MAHADDLDPDQIVELRRLAGTTPRSGRHAVAKLGAIRTIERLNRGRRTIAPMPAGWHPSPGSEWEQLDAHDSREDRERWWRALQVGR